MFEALHPIPVTDDVIVRIALPPDMGVLVCVVGRFWDILGLCGDVENPDLGARKSLKNGQKYL